MINFLHTFNPEPILISFGPINIYWYGLFIILGILASIVIVLKLASYLPKEFNINKNVILDLSFWLILGGITGARIYHIFLELPYYINNPLAIFKIWQGGLAIHGGIIAGLIIIYIYARKFKINIWLLAGLMAPGLALAQTIGRWGNYFNQEIFGKPTNLSWGIPINITNRPFEYISFKFFHPTFLYESLGSLFIFLTLILIYFWLNKKQKFNSPYYLLLITYYLISYSLLRFFLEFIRIDKTPVIASLRWPQIASLLIITIIIFFLIYKKLSFKNK